MTDLDPGLTRPAPSVQPAPRPPKRDAPGLIRCTRLALSRWQDFSGRSRRREFWFFVLAIILVQIAVLIVHGLIFGPEVMEVAVLPGQTEPSATRVGYTGGIWNDVIGFLSLTPLLAVGWRRLHDRDYRGWWLLVPFALMFTAAAVMLLATFGPTAIWAALTGGDAISVRSNSIWAGIVAVGIFATYILLIIQLARAGTPGPNRFGPDPREVTP